MQLQKYESRAKHRVSESTLNARLAGQRSLQSFIGEDKEPTPDDVEEWVDHLIDRFENGDIKASTIREYFKAIRYYFRIIHGDSDDIEYISNYLPKNDADPGDYLTLEEWDRLRNAVQGYRDRAFVEVMYFYGRRPTEVILLNEEDIDLEEETITFNILKKGDPNLPVLETEDDSYRVLRATFELKAVPKHHIEKWLPYNSENTETIVLDDEEMEVTPLFSTPRGRISYNTVYHMVKQASKRARIDKNITPKAMGRHSRATHLDWDGNAPGNIARDILLHDPDTSVIGRYIHDREEDQVREVMTLGDEE